MRYRSDYFRWRSYGWLLGPAYTLFFMMLFVPTTYQAIKAVLLALVLAMIVVGALSRRQVALHITILLWTVLMVATGLAFMLTGLANGAPGAWRMGTVYVLWPVAYTVLAAGAANQTMIDGLLKTLVFATFAIGFYTLSFILTAGDWLPDMFYIELAPVEDQGIGFYEGFVEYWLGSMSSLLFLVPFLFAALLTWPKGSRMPVARLWLWLALIMSLVLVLLSGRRALLLVVAVAPVIALAFCLLLPRHHKLVNRKSVKRVLLITIVGVLGVYVCLQVIFGLDIQAVVGMFMAGFDFMGGESPYVRKEQFIALLQEWSESPLLGAGHGAVARGSLRSYETPWAYELSYLALLFHAGLVGFSLYSAAVAWMFWMGFRMIRSGDRLGLYMLPVLVGTSCFLIANATNPYLEKFDYMWVIFLPVALVNFWLLGREKERSSAWRSVLVGKEGTTRIVADR